MGNGIAMNPEFASLPLSDPHLPEPISWWPPSPGWWGLMILSALTLIVGFVLLARIRGARVKRNALRNLDRIDAAFHANADKHRTMASLSTLLRRVSLSLYPRERVAGLTGEDWLSFLDEGVNGTAQTGGFSQGAGRSLIEAPYNPGCDVDLPSLLALTRTWITEINKATPG